MDPSPASPGSSEHERAERIEAVRMRGELLVIDVRRFTPALVKPFLTAVIDQLVSMDARDQIIIVCDYEPSGMAYQLDLRPQTRGLFHYECVQRADGAWVETIRRL